MRLRQYLNEGKLSRDEWNKRYKKIVDIYYRQYKKLINTIIKSPKFRMYQSWDDIQSYAMDNVNIRNIEDELTTKFLSDFEASLEAILSSAQDEL
jgi:hypothetical protein